MIELLLIGIGTGNPEHLTLQAVRLLGTADLVLIPRKGEEKAALADLRRTICAGVPGAAARIVEFDLPRRDVAAPDYLAGVGDWHDAIAAAWAAAIAAHLPDGGPVGGRVGGRVALLVWGDPSLYDSSLRIAERLRAGGMALTVEVVPGITSLQTLAAAHAVPLNDLGAPVLVTTGRRLRDGGWPPGTDAVAVMLDGGCAFETLDPAGLWIWWGAYLGMPQAMTISGPLAEAGPRIAAARAAARAEHGWIMDTYLLRRGAAEPDSTKGA